MCEQNQKNKKFERNCLAFCLTFIVRAVSINGVQKESRLGKGFPTTNLPERQLFTGNHGGTTECCPVKKVGVIISTYDSWQPKPPWMATDSGAGREGSSPPLNFKGSNSTYDLFWGVWCSGKKVCHGKKSFALNLMRNEGKKFLCLKQTEKKNQRKEIHNRLSDGNQTRHFKKTRPPS